MACRIRLTKGRGEITVQKYSAVMSARNRLFYDLPERDDPAETSALSPKETLINYVNDNLIGSKKVFSGPFGQRNGMSSVFAMNHIFLFF